jgi:pyruvate dehydrogenase (quinone)
MHGSVSGSLASVGAAVPYAISAKFAHPDRVSICFTGDGAMQMNGLNELITVEKYWKNWSDPHIIFIVLNNRDLNQVTWELRIEGGDPKIPITQDIPDFPYATFADSVGLKGIRVDKPEDVGPALDEAFASRRPVVLDVYTDPNVPTLPPHITLQQAKNFSTALLKGDPEEVPVIVESIKGVVEGILPHKG